MGRVTGTSFCISESLVCSKVTVDQVLGGRVMVGQTVTVFNPMWDLIDLPTLHVLRLDSGGVYERLGQLSGSQRLKDGVAERWRMSPNEIRRRYNLLHDRPDRLPSDGHSSR